MKKTNNKKKELPDNPDESFKKTMFLEQVIPMKTVLGWGAGILMALLPISYGLGRWVQRIDDKFEVRQSNTELNEARTQLTLEYNEKIMNLEREKIRLEILLEMCRGKEEKNGK